MSDLPQFEKQQKEAAEESIGPRKVWRIAGWLIAGALILLGLSFGGFAWYSTTLDFQHRVKTELIDVLENATGGRVEVGEVQFQLRHLAVEVDNLVIHGREGEGEAPYFSAAKIQIRIRLFSFFQHTAGTGLASHVSLDYLGVERPQVHLIVYKDGTTNQPVPKHPATLKAPLSDTMLDLKAKQVVLSDGIVLVNDRAIPFDLAARELSAEVHYVAATDTYGARFDLEDLRTRMAAEPEALSSLQVEIDMGRDQLKLKRFAFASGRSSRLTASGSLTHFAEPEWQVKATGSVELPQISMLTGVEGLIAGRIDVDVDGHSCRTAPAVARKHSRLWQRLHRSGGGEQTTKEQPTDADCKAGYLVSGTAALHDADYRNIYVRVHDVNGAAQLKITPTELLLTALTGYLPDGGRAEGKLRITNWLSEVSAKAPALSSTAQPAAQPADTTGKMIGAQASRAEAKAAEMKRAHANLEVVVSKLSLRTIMDAAAPEHYGDLGFDTSANGPVKVEWGGPETDIADTVQIDADVKLAPTGVHRPGALLDVPVRGHVLGHYDGKNETVAVQNIALQTPQSSLDGSGTLGVNLGDRLTALNVDLTVRDLDEYDQLLQTLGLTANGKKGRAAIPVALHGSMHFNGTARGAMQDLDVKGHLIANNLEAQLGTGEKLPIDSLVADAEFSPFSGLAVANSTAKEGTAVLTLVGTFRPRKEITHGHALNYVWDSGTTTDVRAQLNNADIADLLKAVGQGQKIPLTGKVNLNGHAAGPLRDLAGSGHVSMTDGAVDGEAYESAVADLALHGKNIEANHVLLKLHGMQIAGEGGYDLATERLHGHVQAENLVLSKFDTVKRAKVKADAILSFVADANGTLSKPALKAQLSLNSVVYDNQGVGSLSANLHSEGETLYLSAASMLLGTKVDASGQMQLTGDYETTAKVTIAGLNLDRPLAIFTPNKIVAQSSIGGVLMLSGPLKRPTQLSGAAQFNNFDVKLDGIQLKATEPLRLGLQGGMLSLQNIHISGEDTDLQASGTAQVFGVTDPRGGKLDVKTSGNVSVALLHTLNDKVSSSGKLDFDVRASGRVENPTIAGKIRLDHVNVAMEGINNGLSDMEGTLIFDEDRLQVQKLTARTGGGQLNIGGSVRYRGGVFADLSAVGDAIRVRYYGLSTTANANLKLQGNTQGALLSGNVLITRFGIGPDMDFAAFAGDGAVTTPPDPNALPSKIRLDVHVTSSPQLDFQNSYAKLAGTADIRIRGTAGEPTVLGRIQITDGSATFAGTKYQLQRGDIYFTNPVRIDPIIDLDATARVESYDVTIGLHGTTTNLKPTYRSEPPLSESDVFALLALGRTQEEAQLYQEQQVQMGTDPTTSSLLGGALNATVSNRMQKLFGVGSVKIDPAFVGTLGGSSARITVQQQLSRQLTATYATNVNTQAQQLIQLEYDLSHNISIVATRDETGVFSVVYKLRRRYR